MSYIALANTTLSGAASSVTFSNIPTTVNGFALRDLILVITGTTSSDTNPRLEFNGSTSNLSWIRMGGNGSSAFGSNASGNGLIGELDTSTQGVIISQIMDFSANNKHKMVLSRSNDPSLTVQAFATRWAVTDVITSVKVLNQVTHNFNSGCTFALYGIAG